MRIRKRVNGLLPWWYWMWLVHGAFVFALYYKFSYRSPDWFKASFSSISLAHEKNYAVWWAGICLLLAALIFYRIGSLKKMKPGETTIWYILAVVALALSFDEIGSLHELVSGNFGWLGLLPFALVFGSAFGYSVVMLLKHRDTRLTAVLVVIAVSLFVSVAGLEYVEHNIFFESRSLRRFRLIAEEGTELVGVSLLIIAGLIALVRYGTRDRRIRRLAGGWQGLAYYRDVIFLLFIIHVVGMLTFSLANESNIVEGNPASVFPIYLYFMTAMACFFRAGESGSPGYLRATGIILLLTSIAQTYNFNRLFNNLFALETEWFTGVPGSWLVTLIPLTVMAYTLQKANHIDMRKVVGCALVILVVLLLVYPGKDHFMTYYLYSGCVAYACFWLLDASTIPTENDAPEATFPRQPS